jgi:hypothetical protein
MLQFRVTVTDDVGATATRDAYVVVNDITPPLELTVTDAAGSVQQATQRVVINQGMQIAGLTCPAGTVNAGSDVTVSVQMAGGSTPVAATAPLHYTWTTQTPALTGLPDAATFTKTVPSGTAAGTMTVTVEVRDSSSPPQVQAKSCTVTIGAAAAGSKPGSICMVCGDG